MSGRAGFFWYASAISWSLVALFMVPTLLGASWSLAPLGWALLFGGVSTFGSTSRD